MIRISAPPTPIFSVQRRQGEQAGFTLIEILIVIGLIALATSLIIPNFGMVLKLNLGTAERDLANTIRDAHDEAVLRGQVYRMAFDLDHNTYWVEMGGRNYLLLTEKQAEAKKEQQEEDHFTDDKKKKQTPQFSLAKDVTRRKRELPKGVKFEDVITAHTPDGMKKGIAYAYFFPQGFVEKLMIHLTDNYKRHATLLVNPVTGKSRLFKRYLESESAQ